MDLLSDILNMFFTSSPTELATWRSPHPCELHIDINNQEDNKEYEREEVIDDNIKYDTSYTI